MNSPTYHRTYRDPSDEQGKQLLSSLLEDGISAAAYRDAMFRIGQHLGETLAASLTPEKSYCVVSTVEDADYLSKGIIEAVQNHVAKTYLACFWNDRKKVNNASVAPIVKQYFEEGYEKADELIVVKSIIFGSCVVKTNITALFETVDPSSIFIVSPVMHEDSNVQLEKQFPRCISDRFSYLFLAKDKDVDNGNVIPGIGGSVYEKLGFENQSHKNRVMPSIVMKKLSANF